MAINIALTVLVNKSDFFYIWIKSKVNKTNEYNIFRLMMSE